MSLLSLSGLHISVDPSTGSGQVQKEIIHGIDLEVPTGEVHAVMGPNGSGKSTVVNALAGHPRYVITQGSVQFSGQDLLVLEPHERARMGMFLAMQYPKEIAGVTLRSFLFASYKAQIMARDPAQKAVSPVKFKAMLEQEMRSLHMDPAFAERSVNKGFSGGEKKKSEVLQMRILKPRLALLDETDSGLDVDALKVVAQGVESMRGPNFSALIVTHYARILEYIVPDRVHVMIKGKIVESGGAEFARKLEKEGYAKYL
jgi:Fe-S cluster assembly ATP-binding protein